jgi:poly(beta-D-mannuronate) lyase
MKVRSIIARSALCVVMLASAGCSGSPDNGKSAQEPAKAPQIEKPADKPAEKPADKPIDGPVIKASTSEQLTAAIGQAKPGDTILMSNGVWKDTDIVFLGEGTEDKPITLRAETPGQVVMSGKSTLSIAGAYLVVDGLSFKDGGDVKDSSVIQFRYRDKQASYSRITNIEMLDYNPASREKNTKWVNLYGHHNRVDHSYFKGKTNIGALLVVWRDDNSAQYHQIDNNHFAGRPQLKNDKGAVVGNEGETIRIGTSTHSLSDSYTTVLHNLFEDCDGEIETISIKSGKNVIKGNTLLNTAGTITLRHGNGSRIEGNVILANGKASSGGIRVIGGDHVIVNNYISGIPASSSTSRGAIVLTNGVPNSPLEQYFQVTGVTIAHNTLVNNDNNVIVGDKKSDTNPLPPVNTTFADNLISSLGRRQPLIQTIDSSAQIKYEGNILNGGAAMPAQDGLMFADPLLAKGKDELFRPTAKSPVIDAAKSQLAGINTDFEGQPRLEGKRDVGADELSAAQAVSARAQAGAVGPDWRRIKVK